MEQIKKCNNIDKRNYGVDSLRIISMLFVLILHALGQGGILYNTPVDTLKYQLVWLMEICAYCAVDVFALISGYVSYTDKEKRTKFSNYFNIWFQVVFYALIVTVFYGLFSKVQLNNNDYISAFFPLTNKLYWYFTAYTGLFILMPFINKAIRSCSKITLKKTFIAILLVFSFYDIIPKVFILNNGYSFAWILLLYILGAVIKKCEIGKNIKSYQAFLIVIFLWFVTWWYKIYGWEFKIFGISITKSLFISYTSITITLVSIFLLIGFSKLKFNNILKKLITFCASSSFAIYLLNCQKIFWKYTMKDLFINLINERFLLIFVNVIAFTFVFAIGAILIDKIRMFLFRILKIDKLSIKIENVLNKIITKIITKI